MRQIEITTYVNHSLDEVDKILTAQSFRIIRKSRIEDDYKVYESYKLNRTNILDVLSKCVLIRYLNIVGEKEFKKITYKKKEYQNDLVLSEEKISINIDDIKNANKLFDILGFRTIVNVKYNVVVYSNDDIELCFQEVEGLGLLLEYENENNFDVCSNEEIIREKIKMLNEVRKYKLNVTDDVDIKKAYILIKKNMN